MTADSRSGRLAEVLQDFKRGAATLEGAIARLDAAFFQTEGSDLTMDHDRPRRTGAAEVIYGEHKTPQQIIAAFQALRAHGESVLATRVDAGKFAAIESQLEGAEYHAAARAITFRDSPAPVAATSIAVVTAGTSDAAVAEEAAVTCEFYGNPVTRISDVGVAGIHRLLARLDELRMARVVVAVAGMEGALPSVVGGLVDKPVIAVPTSVGYGAAFGGLAALLGMLNSCASGVSVVNIDNGFGAGFLASRINRL